MIGGSGEGGGSADLSIQQNGADTKNKIEVEVDQSAAIVQDNQTKIDNILAGLGSTGDNKVKDTTGGMSLIQTGDAEVDIDVKNQAGFNSAALDCGCATMEVSATIKKNGADSASKIKAKLSANQAVSQTNSCGKSYKPSLFKWSLFGKKGSSGDCFDNHLTGAAATGANAIKGSTDEAEGDPAILTGMSKVVISAENTAGANTYPMLYW
jgi:hypothetical protein